MNKILRLPAASVWAVATALLLLPVAAPAAPKPEPAAPVPGPADTITAADVKSLREAIATLHSDFDRQGKILEKNSDDLGRLANRVDDYLRPSTLDPLKASLATVVNKLNEVKEAQGRQAEARDKQAADLTAQVREIMASLTHLQEQLAISDKAVDATIAQLRQTIVASRAPAPSPPVPADNSVPLLPLSGVVFAATLVLAGIILWSSRMQRRAYEAAQAQLAAALTHTREGLLAEIRTGGHTITAAGAVPAPGGADSLAEIRAKLHHVLEQLKPPVPAVQPDDLTTKNLLPPDDRDTARDSVPAASGISSSACWPAPFLVPDSPLARWRERIESHLDSPEHPALPVFSALLALRTLCARQPAPALAEVGMAVTALSQTLYAYWGSLPDLSDDELTRASSDWIQAVKALTSSAAPKLEIREVIVGARFDSDSMQTVQEGPGNHLAVAAVFSWATLDRSGERVKILQRARIATN